ncbi:hypothetical protein [Nodosilinea sp. P-1105]|uniref:hypothetical protein n=1 Tax=Nodosilinea sp. P-1105 TaxID=2546229 RepID=UPI00146A1042|nr:hypothetical protein [Nodosilinea sp. P-1105]NMF85841.1 hypothetical protein [Nodosilinea sp. P-1105]
MTLSNHLIAVFQRSYRRRWTICRLYWVLVQRESRHTHRPLLEALALRAERSAVRAAIRLSRLGAPLPSNRRTWRDVLSCWLLAYCPLSWAIAWLKWLENRDLRDLKMLLNLRQRLPGRHCP